METLKAIAEFLGVKPAHLKSAMNNHIRSQVTFNDNWNVENLKTTAKAIHVINKVYYSTFGAEKGEKLTEKLFTENFKLHFTNAEREAMHAMADRF